MSIVRTFKGWTIMVSTVQTRPPAKTDTDQHGVEFGNNCLTLAACKRNNLCFGTCKLY